MFARDPDAMLAAMVYLRGVLDRWGKTGSGAVRKYLRTHPEAACMQDGEIAMAIEEQSGPVTLDTVKNTRQELADLDQVLQAWHDPAVVAFLKTGQKPKKEKSKTVRKGKKQVR
jgi:hypothetical protein